MKTRRRARLLAVLVCALAASGAHAFDWPGLFCNYGGGIESGDHLLGAQFGFRGVPQASGESLWFTPAMEFRFALARPLFGLPFTIGGYAGFDGYGYTAAATAYHQFTLRAGGEVLYHVRLPVERLDVYAGARLGIGVYTGNIMEGASFDLGLVALGGTWFFTDWLGANLEFGYPTWIRAGVTFRPRRAQ